MHQRLILISGVLVLFVLSITFVSFTAEKHILQTAGKAANPLLPDEDASGGTQIPLTQTETTAYVYGKKLIAQKSQAGTTYNFQDIIGSNTITTDQAGKIQSRFTSYPYGKPLSKESTYGGVQKYTFTGKEDDERLIYFGARYLDTRTGKFMSTDPLSTPGSTYLYAANNPLRYTDPTGMAEEELETQDKERFGLKDIIKTFKDVHEFLSRTEKFPVIDAQGDTTWVEPQTGLPPPVGIGGPNVFRGIRDAWRTGKVWWSFKPMGPELKDVFKAFLLGSGAISKTERVVLQTGTLRYTIGGTEVPVGVSMVRVTEVTKTGEAVVKIEPTVTVHTRNAWNKPYPKETILEVETQVKNLLKEGWEALKKDPNVILDPR